MFYIILTLDLTIFCCLSQLPRHCDTNHGNWYYNIWAKYPKKNGEKEEKMVGGERWRGERVRERYKCDV